MTARSRRPPQIATRDDHRPTYSEAPDKFDRRAFRTALGHFPTGVTVITARDDLGGAVGLTVNSFNSVSLRPPLVLWSLARSSPKLNIFEQCEYYAVNVLAEGQVALSRSFGGTPHDRFAGIEWEEGLGGAPLIAACAAHFECRNEFRHQGGDHLIFVGQVERFATFGRRSLVFSHSRYHVVGGVADE